MVTGIQPIAFAKGDMHAMTLDQSALLEVLDALKAAEVDEEVRQAAETIYQALIEAELSAVIGAFRISGPRPGPDTVMATDRGR